MKTSKLAGLRKPFVVTVAAAATAFGASACSGSIETVPSGDGVTTPTTSTECNKEVQSGSACAKDGDQCSWGNCGGGPDHMAYCQNGKWQVTRASCNPPAPTGCPASLPMDGTTCFGTAKNCGYGDCGGRQTDFASCVDNKWTVSRTTCNPPPPPVCPTDVPKADSACGADGQKCGYGDCYGQPVDSATCKDGKWEVLSLICNPPPPPMCPTEAPEAGSACSTVGASCDYGDCSGTPTTTKAACKGGVWQVSSVPCNPPPPSYDAGTAP